MAEHPKTAIFMAHRSNLIDYAVPIVGSRDLAEDIVQEAYLRFVQTRTAAEPERPLSYLYRIVRNTAVDLLRRSRLEARHLKDEPVYWTVPQPQRTPEQIALDAESLRGVSEAMATLPSHVRLAVEMHRLGGYTMEEIAEHLGVSVPTVHRMIRGAMVRIAAQVDP